MTPSSSRTQEARAVMQALAEVRHALGWSQGDVAVRAGVTRQSVALWERGRTEPRLGTLIAWLRSLGLVLSYRTPPSGDAVERAAWAMWRADGEPPGVDKRGPYRRLARALDAAGLLREVEN